MSIVSIICTDFQEMWSHLKSMNSLHNQSLAFPPGCPESVQIIETMDIAFDHLAGHTVNFDLNEYL